MSAALFELVTPHATADALPVATVTGSEAVNDSYGFDVACNAALGSDELAGLEKKIVGSRATLRILARGAARRWVHGVVTEVFMEQSRQEERVDVLLRLEPRLSLMRLNTHSRIYQNKTVPEICQDLCARWQLPLDLKLKHEHRPRVYCTQYEETDFDFLRRVLASEGLFFYFDHPAPDDESKPGEERLVLSDHQSLYPALGGSLLFVSSSGALISPSADNQVMTLGRGRRLRPQRVLLGDNDFRKPKLPLRSVAEVADDVETGTAAELLRRYHHASNAEIEGLSGKKDLDQRHVETVLEQHRVDAQPVRGTSNCRRLLPGHTFKLEQHPLDHMNASYVVTRVDHDGRVTGPSDSGPVYQNRFECLPAEIPCRPARETRRRRQVAETATVVGPPGESIWTDHIGRIQVRFHWDLEGEDAGSACWLRVAQPWTGTHFGAQFVPRVGSEVLVTFLGGDVDRPLVTGGVYNGTHPSPFDLPQGRAVSGFRTQSTPGDGGGYNELSFSDDLGTERVYLRAQGDFDQEVLQNHRLEVGGDDTQVVTGNQSFLVTGDQTVRIGGDHEIEVMGGHKLASTGAGMLSFGRGAEMHVGRELNLRVEGDERKEVRRQSTSIFHDDVTTRVRGHLTQIVGEHDARRSYNLHVEGSLTSYSSGTSLVSSEKDVVIRCGKSSIRLTPDGIELKAPALRIDGESVELLSDKRVTLRAAEEATLASKKVLFESEKAFIGLSRIVKVSGETVKLNCQPDPLDKLEPPERPKKTVITLKDEKGNPLPKQRYVLVFADGSEQSGVLDEAGEVELELEESGQIVFPDVDNPRPA
jgi:type VI secretion system secreted protein VgrG